MSPETETAREALKLLKEAGKVSPSKRFDDMVKAGLITADGQVAEKPAKEPSSRPAKKP